MTESSTGPGASPGVQVAFALGGHVVELYYSHVPDRKEKSASVPVDLPGLSELSSIDTARLRGQQIAAALVQVCDYKGAGQTAPDAAKLNTLLGQNTRAHGEVKEALEVLHLKALTTLTAVNPSLGKSYGLGRALAQTCLLPPTAEDKAGSYKEEFGANRIANLQNWLSELKSAFPAHSAQAVQSSLALWVVWVPKPQIGSRPFAWEAEGGKATDKALHRQGQVWRAVLMGEKSAVDSLTATDYVKAAGRLLGRFQQLLWEFLRRFWVPVGLVILVLIALVYALTSITGAAAEGAAVLGILATLGISFKGLTASLGKVLNQAEQPVWEAELDESIAVAVTCLP